MLNLTQKNSTVGIREKRSAYTMELLDIMVNHAANDIHLQRAGRGVAAYTVASYAVAMNSDKSKGAADGVREVIDGMIDAALAALEAADEPTADEPTADEPTADEPTADEPTAKGKSKQKAA